MLKIMTMIKTMVGDESNLKGDAEARGRLIKDMAGHLELGFDIIKGKLKSDFNYFGKTINF